MNKFNIAGSLLGAGGVVVLGFQTIAAMMHTDNLWKCLTLSTATDHQVDGFIEMLPFEYLQNCLIYLVRDLPLYQLLVASGVICFILGFFSRR